MSYNTFVFETAIHACGYVVEQIKKESLDKVKFALGAVIKGTYVKRVRWDSEGKCFSLKCKALPKYDLPLASVQKKIFNKEFKEVELIQY